MSVLGLYYDYWEGKNLKNIYNKGVYYKSNPRSYEYMKNIVSQKYDSIDIKSIKSLDDLKDIDINSYSEIVLMYPDSIGLGWGKIDKYILKSFNQMKKANIINGRRRTIIFNENNIFSLKFKRLLERTLLFEIIFSFYFIIVTPFLLAKDFLNGK